MKTYDFESLPDLEPLAALYSSFESSCWGLGDEPLLQSKKLMSPGYDYKLLARVDNSYMQQTHPNVSFKLIHFTGHGFSISEIVKVITTLHNVNEKQ